MGSQEALIEHVLVEKDQICSPPEAPVLPSTDPEDGITPGIHEALNDRKGDTKVHSWEGLWHLLFPADLEIPEPDFIPPTELDEVHVQFSSDRFVHQLRQRIQEGLILTGSVDNVLAIFQSHIDSVFDACRRTPGGPASAAVRKRRQPVRPEAPRQPTSRRSSTRLTTGHLTPGRRGSGVSDSSLCSPIATPGSSSLFGNTEQPLTTGPQPQLRFAPPTSGYTGAGADLMGGMMTWMSPPGSSDPVRVDQPAPGPSPAPIMHQGFPSQVQNTANHLGGRIPQQPRLQPMDSGVDLNQTFPSQQVTDFSVMSSFGSQDLFQSVDFGQQKRPRLSIQPVQQQGVRAELMFTPEDPVMVPSISVNHDSGDISPMDNDGFEVIAGNGQWIGSGF
ncbi:hypothetical protein VTI74DRAFT_4402 [Chaetomium olivicolor]